MKVEQCTIIVGAQWGDEGKGKIADYCAKEADYAVRFHAGNNAGHTLVAGKEIYKLHLVPSGILNPRCVCVIGAGTVIDPRVLIEEIDKLGERGIHSRLKISQRAHVIFPYHIALDSALSEHQGSLAAGSTKRGIAPVYADKAYRHGIRMIDLLEPDIFKEKLKKAYQFNEALFKSLSGKSLEESLESIFQNYTYYGKRLSKYVCDTEYELSQAYREGKRILFEGAQGMCLDLDHGLYPYNTSSNNVAGYAEVGSGLAMNHKSTRIGVMKAYVSRVGESPFPTELKGPLGQELRERGHEYGTTTGRARRVGWLDLVQVRQSVRLSGLNALAITKLDILGGLNKIKICVGYRAGSKSIQEMPASLSLMRNAKPVYLSLPGWRPYKEHEYKRMTEQGYDSMPREMKIYTEFIEKNLKCPLSIISLGPDRELTIIR
ncbi:MAG: adenylosuccinate synthase [Candidatus Magasanikbacteria bacterium]|nr:adenylosuccinate synthase [Candidatus Magasanikbacteria bacterium]